ncbi:MAG: chemotaxis protein CheB [Desulfobacteraceae bacterium]|nr:chemotaxis protein CheB [Desulfobacteraceae bacterium]
MMESTHSSNTLSAPMAIIAIGSSAGGLEAIRTILTMLPSGKNAAVVILQHHDPHHHHLLSDILDQSARVPVRTIADRMPIEADHIFIPPPGQHLCIEQGLFKQREIEDPQSPVPSIDAFLISLAKSEHHRGVAIILSGKGSDGACGIREFKASGGIIIAQSPESAKFSEMPRAALATGCVDLMLTP